MTAIEPAAARLVKTRAAQMDRRPRSRSRPRSQRFQLDSRSVNSRRPRASTSVAGRQRLRSGQPRSPRPRLQFEWTHAVRLADWRIYRSAIRAIRAVDVPFLLGGGFALAAYTGRWRNTKDIDFYIRKADRAATIAALTAAGFKDYYDQLPYDRKWIFRGTRSGVIVDIIWSMANQRAQTDELWFRRARPVMVCGEALDLLPIEEFLWCKVYILQHDHCDWTDVFNLLYATGGRIDWDHLLWRLDEDWPVLKSLLTLYGWLCPRRARALPESLRRKLWFDRPEIPRRARRDRIRLLDTRRWFAALLPKNQPLEI